MILYNLPLMMPNDRVSPGWQPDWPALARHIVTQSLKVRPGERVLMLADPVGFPGLVDAVREEIQRASAIELAMMLAWTPGVADVRARAAPNAADRRRRFETERTARGGLFQAADVWILLPHDEFQPGAVSAGETEWILRGWRGRGVHFHWAPDPGTPKESPVHEELYRSYERAVLDLDYEAHHRTQVELASALRGASVRITTPSGTDLTFDLLEDGWYHVNDGDASPAKVATATCARDREEELPCGNVRVIPAPHSVNGLLRIRGEHGAIASGFDFEPYLDDLTFVFRAGRIVEVGAGSQTDQFRREWARLEGDNDRLSELILGTNPLLPTPPEARIPAYWGSGAGVLRFHLGTNVESGGSFESSLSANFFSSDATMTADGAVLFHDGRLHG